MSGYIDGADAELRRRTMRKVSRRLIPFMIAMPAPASGIALVNSISNRGGFFGPYFTGWLRQLTNSFSMSLLMLAGFLVLNGIVVLIVGRSMPPARRLEAPAPR